MFLGSCPSPKIPENKKNKTPSTSKRKAREYQNTGELLPSNPFIVHNFNPQREYDCHYEDLHADENVVVRRAHGGMGATRSDEGVGSMYGRRGSTRA